MYVCILSSLLQQLILFCHFCGCKVNVSIQLKPITLHFTTLVGTMYVRSISYYCRGDIRYDDDDAGDMYGDVDDMEPTVCISIACILIYQVIVIIGR